MKQIFTLVFVLFFTFQTLAQRWFPMGATLTYSQWFWIEFPHPPIQPAEWKVVDSTLIKGKVCREFKFIKGLYSSDRLNHTMYVYDSNSVVYWYRPHLDSFTVLYDFNKNVGESWEIFGIKGILYSSDSVGCTLTARVKEKGTVVINGYTLRTMRIEIDYFSGYAYGFNGTIVEFIGHLTTPRPDPYYSCRAISESNDFFNLRCFDHPDIGSHDFKLYPSCDYVESSIDEFNAAQDLKISPNPVNDFFKIEYHNLNKSDAVIVVTNLLGQQIAKQSLEDGDNNFSTLNWTSGLYLYQIIHEGKIVAKGKISKQ